MARLREPLENPKAATAISAAAARELADTTDAVRKHIFKYI